MPSHDEIIASLVLNDLGGLGPIRLRELIAAFGSAAAAVSAGPDAWRSMPAFADAMPAIDADWRAAFGRAKTDMELVQKQDARIYLGHDGPYPEKLRHIGCPPPLLYALGEDIGGDERAVALVGSRASTHYGEKMADRFAGELAAAGVVVVSGLARGIDTRAHRAALSAGGRTWAVVGSGLLMMYPPENRELADQIAAQGAVISEFPMATKPHPSNFPRRNRVIAGLSSAVVVVEGGETSGSLITARLAAEEGRDVFAVPGPVTSMQSRAPHRLLRHGAALAEEAADVLVALGWEAEIRDYSNQGDEGLPESLGSVVRTLGDVPLTRDELLERLRLTAVTAAPVLLELEMRGLIRTLPGGKLVRA